MAYSRVMVTGGNGFLGQSVVGKLLSKGTKVFVPDSRSYDLRKLQDVKEAYDDAKPDAVIHLAARVGGIGANRISGAQFFYDNLIMGTQLLDEARKRGIRKFITIGTVCSYPKDTPTPFHEEDLWNGYPEETNAPYGLAKRMLAEQTRIYAKQYGFNGIYLILANLYGPGDNNDPKSSHVIPAIVSNIHSTMLSGGTTVTLWGTGQATRDFLYVEDAASAIYKALEQYNAPDPVNVGTGIETSIYQLAYAIKDIMGYEGTIQWNTAMPDGQPRRVLDTSKAKERFGFEAKTALRDGLFKTLGRYSHA